jgi:hypothetical protein
MVSNFIKKNNINIYDITYVHNKNILHHKHNDLFDNINTNYYFC